MLHIYVACHGKRGILLSTMGAVNIKIKGNITFYNTSRISHYSNFPIPTVLFREAPTAQLTGEDQADRGDEPSMDH